MAEEELSACCCSSEAPWAQDTKDLDMDSTQGRSNLSFSRGGMYPESSAQKAQREALASSIGDTCEIIKAIQHSLNK